MQYSIRLHVVNTEIRPKLLDMGPMVTLPGPAIPLSADEPKLIIKVLSALAISRYCTLPQDLNLLHPVICNPVNLTTFFNPS